MKQISKRMAAGTLVLTTAVVGAVVGGGAGTAAAAQPVAAPRQDAGPYDNVESGSTYGIGMIVSLNFRKAVKNRAAVDKGISFDTSDGSKVKGHWFGGNRVDFRPENFWKPGTKVTVHYRLKNVEVAPGIYGGVDSDQTFTIGRDQRTTVDATADTMKVARNGRTVSTVPITAGKAGFDSWNGIMVIEEKDEHVEMKSPDGAGKGDQYDLKDVPHAMRLTDTGTFVHGNSWATDAMGHYNASHGCIGVADTRYGNENSNAGKFFHSSLIGDPVTVVRSKGAKVAPDNGLSGWNLAWSKW
ncbi:Ig-like domain-containing protein [Kitasatospora sp. GP82]|uniref:L,D-transpeptidase n=1 Tax=Kitasatospora sp. GP82 TaxID=3035089 RepID=UPI002476D417|nr:Ig-like domain-containing protein [Kitasatospora sp. GP82]MDH6128039.1 lipoprotein-anchoring transpeptidase ErfK/SrfK [Kitasatospora sp. GP82]